MSSRQNSLHLSSCFCCGYGFWGQPYRFPEFCWNQIEKETCQVDTTAHWIFQPKHAYKNSIPRQSENLKLATTTIIDTVVIQDAEGLHCKRRTAGRGMAGKDPADRGMKTGVIARKGQLKVHNPMLKCIRIPPANQTTTKQLCIWSLWGDAVIVFQQHWSAPPMTI